ncbi:hypothetical protein B0T25DRAFT_243194 [Lasiosphaeria hispida]|uniref:GPI anchored serine-threonine rich protein n=1 Tax=Lasiosphaeria hispida TaxID=260671 RepID=A0AAJ0HEL8_9PEZI|nr:hypothetical protein B0T25DRAFT_243194 [Lasiosphaeria hispida]
MKSILLPIAIFASAALAQTSACAADYIVEACLGTENAKLASCGTNDYVCSCAAYANILTCYNNCPNDPRKYETQGQQQIFCGYASQFPSTQTKIVAPATTVTTKGSANTNVAETTADAGASETNAEAGSGTATGSAASATKTTNGAADLAMNAGGVLAAVAGVVAAVL